jgi:endonuclease/exonuclease/phosphatase family metal-dependent hydrolase
MKSLLSILIISASFSVKAFTIGTYNIRNFDYDQRYRISTDKNALTNIIRSLNADVLSVEEINNTKAFEVFVESKLPGYETVLTQCGGQHGQRLGFIYNANKIDLLSFNEDLTISNPGGQATCDSGSRPMAIGLFQVKATKQKFYGMTVHLKSGSAPASVTKRLEQFRVIFDMINYLKSQTGVQDYFVAGDFNTTEYNSRGIDFVELNKLTKALNMIDLAANAKCTAYWWGGSDDGIESPSILDHVLVSKGLVKLASPQTKISGHCQAVSCREVPIRELGISYESVSDHCPVTAKIQ